MDPSGTRGSGPGCPHTSPITPVRGSPHSHPVSTAPEMPLAEGLVVQSQGFEAKGPPQDLLHDLGQGATPLSPCSACPRGQFPASVSRSLCVWLSPSPLRGTPGQQPRAVTAPEGTPAPAYGCHPQAASWARAWAALYQAAGGAVSWTSSTQSSASVHLGAAGPSLGTLPGGPGRPGGQWQTAASGPQTHRCREAGVPSTQEWGLGCTATPPPRGCPRAVTTQGHLDGHPGSPQAQDVIQPCSLPVTRPINGCRPLRELRASLSERAKPPLEGGGGACVPPGPSPPAATQNQSTWSSRRGAVVNESD